MIRRVPNVRPIGSTASDHAGRRGATAAGSRSRRLYSVQQCLCPSLCRSECDAVAVRWTGERFGRAIWEGDVSNSVKSRFADQHPSVGPSTLKVSVAPIVYRRTIDRRHGRAPFLDRRHGPSRGASPRPACRLRWLVYRPLIGAFLRTASLTHPLFPLWPTTPPPLPR